MTAAALFGHPEAVDRVYAEGRRERLADLTALFDQVVHAANLDEHLPSLADVEVIFATWGQPKLSAGHLEAMPNLKALFYAAGSVHGFAAPLLDRGAMVVSAWKVNGRRVAEFTLAQILLAAKGYFRNRCRYHAGRGDRAGAFHCPGLFEFPVSILGAGAIGRQLISLLKPFSVRVMVFDPFLRDDEARELGVERVSLAEAFERGMVVSNHVANNPATRGMIGRELLERLPAGATFINTGRGATVVEDDLVAALRRRSDLTALLDVTDPEPPPPDSPLFDLPNAHLTTHIAGSIGREVIRMADYVIDQYLNWRHGRQIDGRVTAEMLATMA
ncbi:MAG TPA: hydroxyacid dehydrogenase [Phycisphaerae bacterium]|nr:hydroxyacid dehydrogenase [Phycisphaerae bacterium]